MNPASTTTAPSIRQTVIEVRIVFLLRTENTGGAEEVKTGRMGLPGRALP
jgi:hypothetical protein